MTSPFPISLLEPAPIPALGRKCLQTSVLAEADVVARAQAGDADAFSYLYSQNKKRVSSICMRMVHDYSLAEDLTQEVFLQVHRKLSSFRGEAAFTTWLHRLAVNTVLMHLRKRSPSTVSLEYLLANPDEEIVGRGFGTSDLAQTGAIDRVAIDRAANTLAPGYRTVFFLHDVQGFRHDEIASILKCSRGNTKSQLHKARRVLRGALDRKVPRGADACSSMFMNRSCCVSARAG